MEIEKIPTADLLDILFEGRNKLYGAYDLRKTYNGRLARALAFTVSLCLLLIGGYVLAGKLGDKNYKPPVTVADFSLEHVNREKPAELPPTPKLPVPKVATLAVTIPRIVKDIEVKPEDAPPTVDDIDKVKIGTANQAGIADDGAVAPPVGDGGKGIVSQPRPAENPDSVFIGVQIESTYTGGIPAWQRFLRKNFVVPEEAISGQVSGTVVVQFIVDKKGEVSDVQAISGPDLLKAEAVRVIRKSGKWNVAIQNGRPVNSYKKQPITIQVSD
jgi:protein TonB